jgi:uncharacterized membrane protein (UPF0127 family)
MRRPLSAALLLALAACSPTAGEAAPAKPAAEVHAVSGLRVVPLVVIHSTQRFTFRVEVARTDQEQAKGLMFRSVLGADEGMIFPMIPARDASFWMRNTLIPLDIIFIGRDGRISNIAANAVPYDETPLSSIGPVKAVLELNGGRAAALGITAGDKVEWSH